MDRRQKPYRPEQLAGYERAWRQLSGPGQLSLTIERTNKTLRIVDTRINLAVVTSSSWADHGTEHSLFLIESVVELSPNKAETVSTTVATLSLYALARFYRYSPDTTDAALLDELRTISKLVPPMLSAPAMTRVQIPTNNGTWLGHVSPFSDTAALKTQTAAIRTFN